MGIRRRKGSPYWWADYTVKGVRLRYSLETASREQAEVIFAKHRSDALLSSATGQRPKISLDEAMARYLDEHAKHLQYEAHVLTAGHKLISRIGKNVTLDMITDDVVARYVAKRRGDTRWAGRKLQPRTSPNTIRRKRPAPPPPRPISPATVNRELDLLRIVMNRAKKLWKRDVADVNWRAHRLKEAAPIERFLSPEEAERLLACAAPHLRPVIITSLYTGLRLRNVVDLQWSEVDLQRRVLTVRLGKKSVPGGAPHTIPMAGPLFETLANLDPKDEGPVFVYEGEAVTNMRKAFEGALRRAGISNFRWHDMRHTAASWMIDADVPLDLVQKILGHSDIRLTLRYAHRRQEAQRDAVEAIGRVWQPGTMAAHVTTAKKAKG